MSITLPFNQPYANRQELSTHRLSIGTYSVSSQRWLRSLPESEHNLLRTSSAPYLSAMSQAHSPRLNFDAQVLSRGLTDSSMDPDIRPTSQQEGHPVRHNRALSLPSRPLSFVSSWSSDASDSADDPLPSTGHRQQNHGSNFSTINSRTEGPEAEGTLTRTNENLEDDIGDADSDIEFWGAESPRLRSLAAGLMSVTERNYLDRSDNEEEDGEDSEQDKSDEEGDDGDDGNLEEEVEEEEDEEEDIMELIGHR